MAELAAKVVFGTALFVVVLWIAQHRPSAAGMMVTFPALNGIGLLFADPPELEEVAGAMLFLPVINAALCVLYLNLFESWGKSARQSPTAISFALLGILGVGWFFLAWLITNNDWKVGPGYDLVYALGAALAGAGIIAASLRRQTEGPGTNETVPFAAIIGRNRLRILLFMLTLALAVVAHRLTNSSAVLGVLSALPLVGMFSLHAVAANDSLSPAQRYSDLNAMRDGVWFGPTIAITFIMVFWRCLEQIAQFTSGLAYMALGSLLLIVGWAICMMAIWRVHRLARRYSP